MTDLKLRWLGDQCYEMVLPNGKHILIDPGVPRLSDDKDDVFTADMLEACDYVLLTHTHYASCGMAGELYRTWNPIFFVGSASAGRLIECFDLDLTRVHSVYNGQRYEMEDFGLTSYVGRHAGSSLKRERLLHLSDKRTNVSDFGELDVLGNVESMNYYLTLLGNLKLAFVSGEDINRYSYMIGKEYAPNILIRAAVRGWEKAHYGETLCRYGAQLAFPSHHDVVFKRKADEIAQFVNDTEEVLEEAGSGIRFVNPEVGRWYLVALSANLE